VERPTAMVINVFSSAWCPDVPDVGMFRFGIVVQGCGLVGMVGGPGNEPPSQGINLA